MAGTPREHRLHSFGLMNYAYMLHQAGSDKTQAERRKENRRRGELAAALIRPWRRSREDQSDREGRRIR